MQIQLVIERDNAMKNFLKPSGPVIIGRGTDNAAVDVDLLDDASVSRLHARVWHERGEFWIEDTGSKHGTLLNNESIKGRGAVRFAYGDCVRIGATSIRLGRAESRAAGTSAPELPDLPNVAGDILCQDAQNAENDALGEPLGVTVVGYLDAKVSGVLKDEADSTNLERQLDLLCELALKLGAERDFTHLLRVALEQTVCVIPGATRGAILTIERNTGRLMLKAQLPSDYRPSERLARQAIERCEGFTWVRDNLGELTDYSELGNGMCVPLIADGTAVGAFCVDVPPTAEPFSESDLRVFRAIGQFVSMAVEQHQARTLLARQTDFTNRLFRSRFPEKVRNALLADAAEGSLPIGTRQSIVTVLQSDIRGFTRLSEEIGPQRLSDLLNAYFPALIDAVLKYGGAVERFVGDAVFAVFGSPEPDRNQQENAVLAALTMQQAVADITAFRVKRKQPVCGIGIGLDCGEVLHGFIGNADSLEFAVIGDPANYSSRYCAGARAGEILISPSVRSYVWKQVDTERRMILTKHEGEIEAHLVKGLRESWQRQEAS